MQSQLKEAATNLAMLRAVAEVGDVHRVSHAVLADDGGEELGVDHRAVAALRRAGFAIETAGDRPNDGYMVGFDSSIEPVRCFSKVHDRPPNPMKDFIAVMVCDEADRGCPHIDGASERFGIPYRDPKLADDTPEETSTYDERCRDVAREMLWMIEQAAASS